MKKFLLTFFSSVLLIGIIFVISCQKGGSPTSPSTGPVEVEVQDKYILLNFDKSVFASGKFEFIAKGKTTKDTINMGKDINEAITSPNQKISVIPGSGYDIAIRNVNTGEEIFRKNDVATYLFYEEFNMDEPLPNKDQANNRVPWKKKWIASQKGSAAWNHAMNGSFRNLELKKEGNIQYIHMRAVKTGDDDSTSQGSGIQTHTDGGELRKPFYFTYGKVEFRARIKSQVGNPTKGPFPALWLMPAKGDQAQNPDWANWAAGGEIDVMEYVYKAPHKVDQTIHTGDYGKPGNGVDNTEYDFSPGEQNVVNIDQWHTYTLEWKKDGIYWYIDGVQGRQPYLKTDNITRYPFVDKSAFYIIMNVGVGRANNNGSEDNYPGGAQKGLDTWMDVDSVKVMPNADTILEMSKDCEYYQDVKW